MDESKATPGQLKRADELVRLAEEEFGELSTEEKLLLRSAAMGVGTCFGDPLEDSSDWIWETLRVGDAPWDKWDRRSVVKSSFIQWMCTQPTAVDLIAKQGLILQGAYIKDLLDLHGAAVPFPISFFNCAFPCGIRLIDTKLSTLILDSSYVKSMDCDRMFVDGNVHLRNGFCSTGGVRFSGARITGNLSCVKGVFANEKSSALNLNSCKIDNFLLLAKAKFPLGGIELVLCSVETLVDDLSIWPDDIDLTGFRYGAIHPESIGSLHQRLAWLQMHDQTHGGAVRFDPQPYRHLAKVLRHSGHASFADEVMYEASQKQAKARVERVRSSGGWDGLVASWILSFLYGSYDRLVGYGYKRAYPFFYLVMSIVLGSLIFSGFNVGAIFGANNPSPVIMQPTQGKAVQAAFDGEAWFEDYPAFRPLAYSADAFLPLVDLHQETYWTPNHWLVKRVYLPFHILMGWVVTTLAAVSVTGLVRHEKE